MSRQGSTKSFIPTPLPRSSSTSPLMEVVWLVFTCVLAVAVMAILWETRTFLELNGASLVERYGMTCLLLCSNLLFLSYSLSSQLLLVIISSPSSFHISRHLLSIPFPAPPRYCLTLSILHLTTSLSHFQFFSFLRSLLLLLYPCSGYITASLFSHSVVSTASHFLSSLTSIISSSLLPFSLYLW